MLELIPKKLRFSNAGNYQPSLWGLLRDILQHNPTISRESIFVESEVPMVDISFYQGSANFGRMLASGIDGVIIRAGQNKWADTKAEVFMADAEKAGIPIGSYWFYDSRVDFKYQAEMWKKVLGNHKTPLYCWVDYEEAYGGSFGGWKNLYNFLEACKQIMPDRIFGIYTGYYYWLEHSPLFAGSLNYFSQYPLWLAWYTINPAVVKIPKPWSEAMIWQKTSKGDGIAHGVSSLNIDVDSFLGTQEEFDAAFGLSATPLPEPKPEPAPEPIPEPTPVPPISENPTNLYRIVWDDENPDYHYKSRTQMPGWGKLKAPPAVYRFYPVMKEKAGDFRVNITRWKQWILNALMGGNRKKFDYWTGRQRAQFNTKSKSTGFPQLAYLAMSGNVVKGEVVGNWLRFETLKVDDLDRARGMTRKSNPWFIHNFTCVKWKNGKTVHVLDTGTKIGEVNYPLVTKEGYAYIPLRHVRKV